MEAFSQHVFKTNASKLQLRVRSSRFGTVAALRAAPMDKNERIVHTIAPFLKMAGTKIPPTIFLFYEPSYPAATNVLEFLKCPFLVPNRYLLGADWVGTVLDLSRYSLRPPITQNSKSECIIKRSLSDWYKRKQL